MTLTESKPTILVIDDAPANLQLMSGLLQEDYRVKAATSGEKGLKIALSVPQPDLILLDIMMPEMDGYEVCKRLKADQRTKGIPIIFLTAKSEAEDEALGLSCVYLHQNPPWKPRCRLGLNLHRQPLRRDPG